MLGMLRVTLNYAPKSYSKNRLATDKETYLGVALQFSSSISDSTELRKVDKH